MKHQTISVKTTQNTTEAFHYTHKRDKLQSLLNKNKSVAITNLFSNRTSPIATQRLARNNTLHLSHPTKNLLTI